MMARGWLARHCAGGAMRYGEHSLRHVGFGMREGGMPQAAHRRKAARARRREQGLREIRLSVPDARTAGVRKRVREAVGRLAPQDEAATLTWIEAVSEFDGDASR